VERGRLIGRRRKEEKNESKRQVFSHGGTSWGWGTSLETEVKFT
jgi:hypothetical protein